MGTAAGNQPEREAHDDDWYRTGDRE